jgi:hypothetical protein
MAMKKRYGYLTATCTSALVIATLGLTLFKGPAEPAEFMPIGRPAKIRPDYTDTVIPPNIAPLNFIILEPGTKYIAKIHSANGKAFSVSSRNGKIKIPLRPWRSLLQANRGGKLLFELYVKDEHGNWSRYQRIENTIARQNIDSHIAYRLIKPIYNFWRSIGVYQRNLENYDESLILHGKSIGDGCVNCHSFLKNSPDYMFIGTRSDRYGSAAICLRNGQIEKIGTKFGYTAWHPSGRLAAFSLNKVRQLFHTFGMETRDVLDLDGGMAYYNIESQIAKTVPGLTEKDLLETYPEWTPDGKYLYFCSAPILWENRNKMPPPNYKLVKYELRRISYDIQTDQWGQPQTVLSADDTGLSILLPRISPDGRFLLFCMCEYSCFPVYQPSSDLYMMDLETGKYRKLPINSEYSESWHSWSRNGRWIAFSSKRLGGLFTRTYLSYIDENGEAYKPFIMPQKDPAFYDSFLKTYSVPELIVAPVEVSHNAIGRAARNPKKIEVDIPITAATPAVGAEDTEPWKQL